MSSTDTESSDLRTALKSQRRFLLLTSLAILAFYGLGIEPKNEASISGLGLRITQPERLVIALWLVWGWSVWRYMQHLHDHWQSIHRSVVRHALMEFEALLMSHARKEFQKRVDVGEFKDVEKDGKVWTVRATPRPPKPRDRQEVEPEPRLRDGQWHAGATYALTMTVTHRFRGPGESDWIDFPETLRVSTARVRLLRLRGLARTAIKTRVATDYFAPLLIAAGAVITWLVHGFAVIST